MTIKNMNLKPSLITESVRRMSTAISQRCKRLKPTPEKVKVTPFADNLTITEADYLLHLINVAWWGHDPDEERRSYWEDTTDAARIYDLKEKITRKLKATTEAEEAAWRPDPAS